MMLCAGYGVVGGGRFEENGSLRLWQATSHSAHGAADVDNSVKYWTRVWRQQLCEHSQAAG